MKIARFSLLYSTFIKNQRRALIARLISILVSRGWLYGVGLTTLCLAFVNVARAATASPTSVSWASVSVGGIGGQKVVTLANNTASTISITSITLSGADPGDFNIFSKTCTSSLAPNASCTANVTFAPKVSGTRTATLNFNDSASPSPQTVALSGFAPGGASGGSASASPSSLTWVSVAVGGIGGQKTATLTNSGSTALSINSIAITGADPADFRIYSTTCGSSLAAGASCSANIVFAPTTTGTRTGSLSFSDSATNSPEIVALSGSAPGGSSGSVAISPTSLSFGSVNVGSTSAIDTETLTNGTGSSITINNIAVTGADPGDFLISSKTCGSSLAASGSCSVSLDFKPGAGGSRTATLTVSDTASNSPQTVALSGTGNTTSGGSVTVSPTALGFAATAVASTSTAQSTNLTNGTGSSITISSIAIGGANPGDFAISGKTCGASLAPSATCSASVVFKPTVTGPRTATLSFADSGSGSPQTVALSGTVSAAFEIEPTNPTVVVNNTLQFSATASVTWSASCGSITSTSGIYLASSSVGSCTVTATEIGGSHPTVSTTVKVTSSPTSGTLEIYPTSAAVFAGTQQIFQAQLSLVPDGHSLTYSVDGAVGGNATSGTITNEGVYTAPTAAGKHTITVTDNSLGTSVSGSATVYTTVSVNFASRTSPYPVPAHLFGSERMDSLRSTADLDLVKAAGISYARFYALIPTVFATTTPNWATIDSAVQRISAGGVKIMLQMYQTPPWLQPNPNPCGTGDSNVPPTDYTKWGQMAAQYIEHMDSKFPGVVTDYEIWNEPDTAALCTSASNRQSVYLALYKIAVPIMRAQVKADGSNARVGGPATAGLPAAWISAMLSDSVISQNIDFLSYHIYPFSNTQLGAQWDTYNGVSSVLQSTQNSGLGPLNYYLSATRLVVAGKQPQGKNLPIYNSEYNIDWDFAKTCCQNDPTYSPVWNGLFVAGGLDAVYSGAPTVMQHMVYFAATAHPYFCLIGEINANMDCTYPTNPAPYPQYFLYQLFGSPAYLGLQNGGNMAQSLSPGFLGNGLVETAFYTTSLDAIVLINPSGTTLTNVPIAISNSGFSAATGTLYQIENGQSITSSGLSLKSTGGTSYSTTVTVEPYSVEAISIHQ